MDRNKKQSMIRTHRQFMETCLLSDGSGALHKVFDENIFGFGTAIDEKIFGIKEVKKLLNSQQKQSKGLDIKWKIKPVSLFITADENTAIFADDLHLSIRAGKETVKMYIRFSVVLNFNNDHWKVIHWHGSKPEQVESEKDTWGVENWKQKATELERLVDEKTADLIGKNRELEIEASLERVRAVTMGMSKPGDILSICQVFFKELQLLGFTDLRNTLINFWDDENGQLHDYDYSDFAGGNFAKLAYSSHPAFSAFQKKIRKAKDAFAKLVINKDGLKSWQERRRSSGEYKDPRLNKISALYYYFYSTGVGAMGISTFSPISKEEVEVLKKFRNVFDMAYRRYADIQKAEAQAKEAKIEAALERVRSRSMAMHKSDELKEVIKVVLEQFVHLNINAEHAGFYIDYKTHDDMHIWLADPNIEPFFAILPYFDTPTWNSFLEAKAKGTILHTDLLDFKAKNKFYKSLFKIFTVPEKAQQFYLQCKGLAVSTVLLDNVGLYIENFSAIPYTDEENKILLRFGKVFQQTYTRFLDLQKAEAQAREAQIEAALERVRAKAMAMHNTTELKDVVHELRKQMGILGQKKLETCVIHLHDESEDYIQSWAGINPPGRQGEILETIANVPKKGLLIIEEALSAYSANRKEYVIINEGEKLRQWFLFLQKESPDAFDRLSEGVQGNIEQLKAFWSFADFAGGSLLMVTLEKPDEPTRGLLRRFSNVFGLAYRRFADLKQAEAQAREAKIEAALERVRSRTMAMHKSSELLETAELLFDQLKQLGAELQGVAFAICNRDNVMVQKWTSIGIFSHPYNIEPGEERMYEAWKQQTGLYEEVYEGERQRKYYEAFMEIPEFRRGLQKFIDSGYPMPAWQKNHAVTFKHGYLLFITTKPFSETQIFLRFGKVFEQTYTRFLDLQKAEAQALRAEQDLIAIKEAKQKAEEALTELLAYKKTLIQSEKMASLGELTAGIAHEIQNPLNFVNNFSEVSKELLDEMKEAIEKGDTEGAKEIMNDVIQNLEKINHHGKRADGIVKGMLQHSRNNSGQKELTDINNLVDECLRLSFHGMRAKDKSFNAKTEISLDSSLSPVAVVSQEIGRVLLNLFTNAFYSVMQKKKTNGKNYSPVITASTFKEGDTLKIIVHDNGNGIPQKVIDKIFQPFFTTKPTGEGTGLGLSMSYDIITKGHGGDLKVETQEGEFARFVIILPI